MSTGVHRKPKPDLYTVLLVLALIAVIIGIVFLYLEMQLYEFKFQGGPSVVMTGVQDPSGNGLLPRLPVAHGFVTNPFLTSSS